MSVSVSVFFECVECMICAGVSCLGRVIPLLASMYFRIHQVCCSIWFGLLKIGTKHKRSNTGNDASCVGLKAGAPLNLFRTARTFWGTNYSEGFTLVPAE